MICKIESGTTCCSAILFLLPSLTCFLLPTIFGSLSLLRVVVGPQNCTYLLWQATWNLSHQRWDFIPQISQTGLQRHKDTRTENFTLWNHIWKMRAGAKPLPWECCYSAAGSQLGNQGLFGKSQWKRADHITKSDHLAAQGYWTDREVLAPHVWVTKLWPINLHWQKAPPEL